MARPIPSPLEDQARDITGAALQATLVDLVDLSLVAKQAHWNLVGRQFHDVHLHLDELVDTARKYSDEVEKADLVTQDLFIEITGALEEQRWMWQAQNVGYETDKPAG